MSANTPILIVGAGGMLGRAFRELLTARGVGFRSADVGEIDIGDLGSVQDQVRVGGGVGTVINCAAWTDVDAAETHEAEALRVNGTGVANLARACRESGSTLVHFSTDYVFDGAATTPYTVDHPRDPIGAYGRTKAAGESAIEESVRQGLSALLIRTSWLYAPWGKNFVRTIAAAARSKPVLRVVNDQRGRPTSAEHLARSTMALLDKGVRGVRHVTDAGECTWFEFAREIARRANTMPAGPTCRVDPCTTIEYPRPAKRPAYSVLDLSLTERDLGPAPAWTANLADVLARLEP